MSCLQIIQPGFYTTIQDQGRLGYSHLGIPESGAMDKQALSFANLVLNNSQDAAALECTLIGPQVLFLAECAFVLTGGETNATLDTNPIKTDVVYIAQKNQILTIGKLLKGCRAYLAFDGGIQTKVVLGSRSQFFPITTSGVICKGDQFATGIKTYGQSKGGRAQLKNNTSLLGHSVLKVTKGPEYDLLPNESKKQLTQVTFSIASGNRMGIALKEPIARHASKIATGPVLPGTVQLTPSGKLFVLMRDCQVTGGYPRIIQLTEQAINCMAQKKQGDLIKLSFE
jgi:biotin-dependent carboxylase-like uncharacterized protein